MPQTITQVDSSSRLKLFYQIFSAESTMPKDSKLLNPKADERYYSLNPESYEARYSQEVIDDLTEKSLWDKTHEQQLKNHALYYKVYRSDRDEIPKDAIAFNDTLPSIDLDQSVKESLSASFNWLSSFIPKPVKQIASSVYNNFSSMLYAAIPEIKSASYHKLQEAITDKIFWAANFSEEIQEIMDGDGDESTLKNQLAELQNISGEKTLSPFDYMQGLEMLSEHFKKTGKPAHLQTVKDTEKAFQQTLKQNAEFTLKNFHADVNYKMQELDNAIRGEKKESSASLKNELKASAAFYRDILPAASYQKTVFALRDFVGERAGNPEYQSFLQEIDQHIRTFEKVDLSEDVVAAKETAIIPVAKLQTEPEGMAENKSDSLVSQFVSATYKAANFARQNPFQAITTGLIVQVTAAAAFTANCDFSAIEKVSGFSGSINRIIPDASLVGNSSSITLSSPSPFLQTVSFSSTIKVTLNIQHTLVSDLDIFLVDPSNTRAMLLSANNGGYGANFVNTVLQTGAIPKITTVLPSQAPFTGTYGTQGAINVPPVLTGGAGGGTYASTIPASSLIDAPVGGNWKLWVFDDVIADVGILKNWTLEISNPVPECTLPITGSGKPFSYDVEFDYITGSTGAKIAGITNLPNWLNLDASYTTPLGIPNSIKSAVVVGNLAYTISSLNPGTPEQEFRILQIFDLTSPVRLLGTSPLSPNALGYDIAVENNLAYAVLPPAPSSAPTQYPDKLAIFDIADPTNIIIKPSLSLANMSTAYSLPLGIAVKNNIAYIADYYSSAYNQAGLKIYNLASVQSPIPLLSAYFFPGKIVTDVSITNNGVAYVSSFSSDGTSSYIDVLNVTQLSNIVTIKFYSFQSMVFCIDVNEDQNLLFVSNAGKFTGFEIYSINGASLSLFGSYQSPFAPFRMSGSGIKPLITGTVITDSITNIVDLSKGKLIGIPNPSDSGDNILLIQTRDALGVKRQSNLHIPITQFTAPLLSKLDKSVAPGESVPLPFSHKRFFENPTQSFLELSIASKTSLPIDWLPLSIAPASLGRYPEIPLQIFDANILQQGAGMASSQYPVIGTVIYYASFLNGQPVVYILDAYDPQQLDLLTTPILTKSFVKKILFEKDTLYLTECGGIEVVNVKDVQNPVYLGYKATNGCANTMITVDNIAYVAGNKNSSFGFVDVFNITSPSNIVSVYNFSSPGLYPVKYMNSEKTNDGRKYIYLIDGPGNPFPIWFLDKYDITQATEMTNLVRNPIASDSSISSTSLFALSDNYVYVSTVESSFGSPPKRCLYISNSLVYDADPIGYYCSWGSSIRGINIYQSFGDSKIIFLASESDVSVLKVSGLSSNRPSIIQIPGAYRSTTYNLISNSIQDNIVYISGKRGMEVLDMSYWKFDGTAPGVAGNYDIQLVAFDPYGGKADYNFTIRVEGAPKPNESLNPGKQVAFIAQPYNYLVPPLLFEDPNKDTLTFNATVLGAPIVNGSSLPSWLKFNGQAGIFSGTPGKYDIGNMTIMLVASDNSQPPRSSNITFSLQVNSSALIPIPISDRTVQTVENSTKPTVQILLTPFINPNNGNGAVASANMKYSACIIQIDNLISCLNLTAPFNSTRSDYYKGIYHECPKGQDSTLPQLCWNETGYLNLNWEKDTDTALPVPNAARKWAPQDIFWLRFDSNSKQPQFFGTATYRDTNFYAPRVLTIKVVVNDTVLNLIESVEFKINVVGESLGSNLLALLSKIASPLLAAYGIYAKRALYYNLVSQYTKQDKREYEEGSKKAYRLYLRYNEYPQEAEIEPNKLYLYFVEGALEYALLDSRREVRRKRIRDVELGDRSDSIKAILSDPLGRRLLDKKDITALCNMALADGYSLTDKKHVYKEIPIVGESYRCDLDTPYDEISEIRAQLIRPKQSTNTTSSSRALRFFQGPYKGLPAGRQLPHWLQYDEGSNALISEKVPDIHDRANNGYFLFEVKDHAGIIREQFKMKVLSKEEKAQLDRGDSNAVSLKEKARIQMVAAKDRMSDVRSEISAQASAAKERLAAASPSIPPSLSIKRSDPQSSMVISSPTPVSTIVINPSNGSPAMQRRELPTALSETASTDSPRATVKRTPPTVPPSLPPQPPARGSDSPALTVPIVPPTRSPSPALTERPRAPMPVPTLASQDSIELQPVGSEAALVAPPPPGFGNTKGRLFQPVQPPILHTQDTDADLLHAAENLEALTKAMGSMTAETPRLA
jgi:subtilisin-like proprotein convertase family protein